MAKLIKTIVGEAMAYDTIDEIETFIEDGAGLKNIPLQPLYLALRKMPLEKVTLALEKMTKDQRKLVLDIELWEKDSIDIVNFENWLSVYSRCENDELRFEFAASDQFQFYLKSKFNIWTFDAEDPLYPDHDDYFLTEDGLLLFEFSEETTYIDEVRNLVRELYSELGVEKAYAHLFKMVSDSYLHLEEQEYQEKKSRLADYGLVDYFDALEFKATFPSLSHMEYFIRSKKIQIGAIDENLKGQGLHQNTIIAFKDGVDTIEEELDKISDSARRDFLHFNFLQLINGTISLDGALREGIVSMTKTGKKTKSYLLLGFDYLSKIARKENLFLDKNLFDYFTFADIYKIGLTLIDTQQKKVRNNLAFFLNNAQAETFLGKIWTDFLDHALEVPAVYREFNKSKPIVDTEILADFSGACECIIGLAPFVKQFNSSFLNLKEEGNLQDIYYINYNVDDIDFEAILLTSFYNYTLKELGTVDDKKMGITVDEFKTISNKYVNEDGVLTQIDLLNIDLNNFAKTYGMENIPNLVSYIGSLMKEEIEGYSFNSLNDEEFKYIGGPIILSR